MHDFQHVEELRAADTGDQRRYLKTWTIWMEHSASYKFRQHLNVIARILKCSFKAVFPLDAFRLSFNSAMERIQ